MTNSLKKKISVVSIAILFLFSILIALRANIDLSSGRYMLFMDERITFDGVYRIIFPESLRSFVVSLVHGGDHRYGRSLWASIAVIAAIPAYLFDEPGQIIASRMGQTMLLLGAFFILSLAAVRSWFLRLALLLCLCALPYADYYFTMPKPEPLQLLLLALFFVFSLKKKNDFAWHWVFLGLAFGTKISTLPILLFLMVMGLFDSYRNREWKESEFRQALLFLGIGMSLAEPLLGPTALLLVLLHFILKWIRGRIGTALSAKVAIAAVALFGLILSFVATKKPLEVWIFSTLLNTEHSADRMDIGFFGWAGYFFTEWMIAPGWLAVMAFAASLGVLFYLVVRYVLPGNRLDSEYKQPLKIYLSGLCLNLAIFAGVHRLWGFYAFPGTVLMVAGTFSLLDRGFGFVDNPGWRRALSGLAIGSAVLLGFIAGFYWWPRHFRSLEELSVRSQHADVLAQDRSYHEVTGYLEEVYKQKGRKLTVAYDPNVYTPMSNQHYQIVEFWGPFSWSEAPDVIVLGESHTPRGRPILSDSPEYAAFLSEQEGYQKYVEEEHSECRAEKCYIRVLALTNKGEVLVSKY